MNDTDMGMNTANAINALNMGHDVRRKRWDSNRAIRKVKTKIGPHEVDSTMIVGTGGLGDPISWGVFTWQDADIYATDWEIA